MPNKDMSPVAKAGDGTLDHPIVLAALALHGMTAAEVRAIPTWRVAGTVTREQREGAPHLVVSRSSASVAADGWRFDMQASPGGSSSKVDLGRRPPLPQTVLAALVGRRLTDLAEIPGGDAVTVLEILKERPLLTVRVS